MAAEAETTYDVYRYITFYYKNTDGSTEIASKGAYQLMRTPSETYEFTFDAAKASDFITGIPDGWKIENNDIPDVKASYIKGNKVLITKGTFDESFTGFISDENGQILFLKNGLFDK